MWALLAVSLCRWSTRWFIRSKDYVPLSGDYILETRKYRFENHDHQWLETLILVFLYVGDIYYTTKFIQFTKPTSLFFILHLTNKSKLPQVHLSSPPEHKSSFSLIVPARCTQIIFFCFPLTFTLPCNCPILYLMLCFILHCYPSSL